MRIVQCINALTLGGAQTFLLDLCKFLKDLNHEIIIIAFRDGLLKQEFLKLGIKTFIVGEFCFDLIGVYRIHKILSDFAPHVVHSHLGKATFWMRFVKSFNNIPALITTIHGQERNLLFTIEKQTNQYSDFLIFPSLYMANWYNKYIARIKDSNYTVIYPGVKINSYNEKQIDNTTSVNNNKEYIVIGTLARLHPIKGVDVTIKACYLLIKRGYKILLKIGGEGIDKNRLIKLTKDLKIDKYTLWLNEVVDNRSFYKDLDIYISASHQESFGISVCEAMESGVVVVASCVGGIPEIIINGYNGFTFPDGDYISLAEILESLILDKHKHLAVINNAQKTIREKFDRNISLQKHDEIYKRIFFKNTKKICFAISSGDIGGGENLAVSLIKELKQRSWEVSVVCGKGKIEKKLAPLNVNFCVASTKLGGVLWGFKLWLFCKRLKPYIINTHLNKAALYSSIAFKSSQVLKYLLKKVLLNIVKLEINENISYDKIKNSIYPKVISYVHGMNDPIYYRFCDSLIAVSKQIYNHLIYQGIDSKKVFLIRNSIKSNPKNAIENYYREKLSIKIENFGIIAKLHTNKGHKWLLDAIAENKQEFIGTKFFIIGNGPEENSLKNIVIQRGLENIVFFLGFRDDIDNIYKILDVVVLPSYSEGIPLCLLEAMEHGIPVIATNIGGIPEIIEHNLNGFLIQPEDKASFLKYYKKIKDPFVYNILSRNAFQTFRKINNFDKMVDDFEKILLNSIIS